MTTNDELSDSLNALQAQLQAHDEALEARLSELALSLLEITHLLAQLSEDLEETPRAFPSAAGTVRDRLYGRANAPR